MTKINLHVQVKTVENQVLVFLEECIQPFSNECTPEPQLLFQ